MKKAVVSVIGKDKKGIIAGVTKELFELNINVADITQTIMQEYFTMIMLVEIDENANFNHIVSRLKLVGEGLGVTVSIQHEEIFDSMHKI